MVVHCLVGCDSADAIAGAIDDQFEVLSKGETALALLGNQFVDHNPEFRTIDMICEMVADAGDNASIVSLDEIAAGISGAKP